MLLIKKTTSLFICVCLCFIAINLNDFKLKALTDEPMAISSSVDINKEGNNININIDTEKIENSLTNMSNETKNGIEELSKKGFFKRLASWFEEFMLSLFSLFKDLVEMFKK